MAEQRPNAAHSRETVPREGLIQVLRTLTERVVRNTGNDVHSGQPPVREMRPDDASRLPRTVAESLIRAPSQIEFREAGASNAYELA